MKNDAIIDAILCLLKEYKAEAAKVETVTRKANLDSLKYLIVHSIRKYDVPARHRHVSKKAYARWVQLSDEDIMTKHYQDRVFCDKLAGIVRQYDLYKGAKKKGARQDVSEEGFRFREMFHEDHVIPVSLIFNALIAMKTVNRKSVKELLNKMHICILLKEEDHELGRTKNRSLNYQETIRKVYIPNKVVALDVR